MDTILQPSALAALKRLWEPLQLFVIDRVILDNKDIYEVYIKRRDGTHLTDGTKEGREVTMHDERAYIESRHFFGFTSAGIYFSSAQRGTLSIAGGSFKLNSCYDSVVPRKGQFICGIEEKQNNGKIRVVDWFVCSPQFRSFLAFVRGRRPQIGQYEKFMESLLTRPDLKEWGNVLPPVSDIEPFRNEESEAVGWCQIYQYLVKMFMFAPETAVSDGSPIEGFYVPSAFKDVLKTLTTYAMFYWLFDNHASNPDVKMLMDIGLPLYSLGRELDKIRPEVPVQFLPQFDTLVEECGFDSPHVEDIPILRKKDLKRV